MLVFTTKVTKRCFIVNDVTGLGQVASLNTVDEWTNDHSWQEVRRRKDRVKVKS